MDIFHSKKNADGENLESETESFKEDDFVDHEEEREINITKKKGVFPVSNFSEEDDEKQESFMKKKKIFIFSGLIVLLLLFLCGAGFGYAYYERYAQKTNIKELLPGNSSLVIRANINPESSQYKLLDSHLVKFPGHERIMKELDEVGEGITISQFINKKLNERGLDFDQDVKETLGDNAYLLVTSLSPIEDLLQQKVSSVQNKSEKAVKDYLALSEESLERKAAGTTGETRVLGLTSDYFLMAEENEQTLLKPLDFIVGAEIKNLNEARKALNKMMENTQRYKVEKLSYEGYAYFRIVDKESSYEENAPLNLNTSFHSVLGSNWLMSSNEKELHNAILRHKSGVFVGNLLSLFSNNKGVDVIENSLEKDAQYSQSIQNMNDANFNEESLAMIFYRFEPANMFGGAANDSVGNPYYEMQKMFKYPDEIAGIFSIIVQQDGINLRMSSNQHSLEEKDNISFMDGLVKKIPNKLDGRWADVYFEYDNPKSVYYSFKRNNLSDEGLQKWSEILDGVRQVIGVDLEVDLVDQVNGDIAIIGYTGRGLEPEGMMVVGIESQDKVLSTINKILELAKQTYIGISPYSSCLVETPAVDGQGGSMEQDTYSDPFCSSLDQNPAQKEILQEQFDEVLASSVRETVTEHGKIYSYNLPGTELSFDFAFKENKLLFGTHYAIVDAMIKEYGVDPDNMIVSNKYYKQVSENVLTEGYTKVCLNSFGIWNSVDYYLNETRKIQAASMESMDIPVPTNDYQKDYDDSLYAIGSIIKTIKLFGGSDAVSQNGNVISSLYLNIEELPEDQKNKAEEIIRGW